MSVKIRLQRHGRKKAPFYHIVIADSRSPRDGRFIEKIGTYNPMTVPATIDLDRNKAYDWITKGAQPTDTVRAILRYKGVMYRMHLMRGVKKGALTIDQADDKYTAWVRSKENQVSEIVDKKAAERKAHYEMVAGKPKAKKVVEAPAPIVEETPEVVEAVAPVVEEAPAVVEAIAPVVEEAPVVVEAPVVEETPAAVVVEEVVETKVINVADQDPELANIPEENNDAPAA